MPHKNGDALTFCTQLHRDKKMNGFPFSPFALFQSCPAHRSVPNLKTSLTAAVVQGAKHTEGDKVQTYSEKAKNKGNARKANHSLLISKSDNDIGFPACQSFLLSFQFPDAQMARGAAPRGTSEDAAGGNR